MIGQHSAASTRSISIKLMLQVAHRAANTSFEPRPLAGDMQSYLLWHQKQFLLQKSLGLQRYLSPLFRAEAFGIELSIYIWWLLMYPTFGRDLPDFSKIRWSLSDHWCFRTMLISSYSRQTSLSLTFKLLTLYKLRAMIMVALEWVWLVIYNPRYGIWTCLASENW